MTCALVTGASHGVGRAVAARLAAGGARVALHYHTDRSAAEQVREQTVGDDHVLCSADLADGGAIEKLWDDATRALGQIDVLVNNAGIYVSHPPLTTGYDDWRSIWQRTLAVNLFGPAHLSFAAARAMSQRGAGRIVSISSRGAFRGEPTAPAYAASKAGLNAFSQSMAKALAPKGVLFFAIAPGWVATDRVAKSIRDASVLAEQPLGRVATPEEVAEVVAFCALQAPASLTGAVLDVNGASYLRT